RHCRQDAGARADRVRGVLGLRTRQQRTDAALRGENPVEGRSRRHLRLSGVDPEAGGREEHPAAQPVALWSANTLRAGPRSSARLSLDPSCASRRNVLGCRAAAIFERRIMQRTYDRAAEDLGNSIHLEHVNVQIPDQRIAMLFYATGLGLTRDPYLMVADDNMWINVGRSQFHLPTGSPQVLRGRTGIVLSDREQLLHRLARVRAPLADTRFNFREHNDFVEVTCPWGTRIRCHEPDAARSGRIALGIPYVEFDVPVGTAKGIAAFYRAMLEVPAAVANGDATVARVKVGKDQHFLFHAPDE